MICSSQESPKITSKNSLKMLVHILRFIGKHQLHTKWAAFWSAVKSDFDCSFAAHVSHSPPCPAIRAQFVQGLRFAFEPFLPSECFRAVEAAAAAKDELPVTPLRSILATQVGALLYKGEGVAMRYKMYIQTIEERLQQLEDLGCLEEDLQGFRSVVVQEAKLVMESSSSFERKQCVLKYFGENMEIQIVSINDEWSFRLASRMHSKAVSAAQVPRLPWERLLFGQDGRLHGYPETIGVPANLLAGMTNVRMACNAIFEGYGWATFGDMAKIVASQADSLNDLDRFWCLDVHFLQNLARSVGERMVKQRVVDCLPDASMTAEKSIEESMAQVAAIRNDKLTIACGSAFEGEVDLVYHMLSNLQKRHAPSLQPVQKMSVWARHVLGRCENFLTAVVPAFPGTLDPKKTMCSGRAALSILWKKFQATPADQRQLEIAAPFRQFAWMLNQEQADEVEALVRAGINAYQANFLKRSICDGAVGAATGATAPSSASASGSASSSSALARAFLPSAEPPASKPKASSDTLACSKARLLEMFKK